MRLPTHSLPIFLQVSIVASDGLFAVAQGFRRRRPQLFLSGAFVVCALLFLPWLDIDIQASDPWLEFGRIGRGLITPYWDDWPLLGRAVINTLAFAFTAVLMGIVAGGCLALLFHWWPVRVFCASIRAVHEIFWGLIFMQLFGLSATTGVLAIAVPYTGIFARVFADIFAEQSRLPAQTLGLGRPDLSVWLYTVLPQSWAQLCAYSRYRFECALRAGTILGFIGLPTLGFHFESAFKEGNYSEAACLLWVFYLLIASIRWWLRLRLLPVYCVAAFLLLPDSPPVSGSFLWQFISHDIWPRALREGDMAGAMSWYGAEIIGTVLPAAAYTFMLSVAAVVLTGLLVLLVFPFAARRCVGHAAVLGHGLLVFLRSTPELMLAFVFLLLLGPSALPAIFALAIHNSGLIAYLTAREADRLPLRPDHARGANLWAYEFVPRLYPRVSALLLYRWEVIMRESAILGILGVATLGFHVDGAFSEIRFDRAFLLIVATALLNIGVDALSGWLTRTAAGRVESEGMLQREVAVVVVRTS